MRLIITIISRRKKQVLFFFLVHWRSLKKKKDNLKGPDANRNDCLGKHSVPLYTFFFWDYNSRESARLSFSRRVPMEVTKLWKGKKKSRTSSNISAKPFSQHPHITAIVLFHLLLQLSHNILANIFNSYDTERPLEKRGETAHRERRLGRTCAAASRRNGTKKKVVWTLDSETHKHHSIRAQLQKSTISLSVEQDETYGRQEISLRTSQVGRATANKGDCSTSFMWFFFFEHAHTQNADSLSINALRRLWHWSPYWGKKRRIDTRAQHSDAGRLPCV